MIFFETGNGPFLSLGIEVAISILSQITTRSAKGTTGNVDIEPKVGRIGSFIFSGSKVCLAGKDRMISILFEECR